MSQAGRWFQHPSGEPPRGRTRARSRPFGGDVSGGLLVFMLRGRRCGVLLPWVVFRHVPSGTHGGRSRGVL
eukprot:8219893-Pyramimonas_sp.AAC.1